MSQFAAATQLMQIQIPQGVSGGMMLQIQAPSGQLMQVQVPQGLSAGMTFQVQMPTSAPVAAAPQPDPMALFAAVDTDRSGSISDIELSQALSTAGMTFARKTCRYLIGMHDRDRSGTIDQQEFVALWQYLQQWKTCFDTYDTDHGGSIDSNELSVALQQFGYANLGQQCFQSIMRAYDDDKSGAIGLDEFIQLNCELHNLTATFKKLPMDGQGRALITYEQFLAMTYSGR